MVAEAMAADPLQVAFAPDAARRRRVTRAMYSLVIRRAILQGNAFAPPGGTDAIALWEPPSGAGPEPVAPLIGDGLRVLGAAGPARAWAMARFFRFSLTLHHRHAPGPHWYLALVAVHPRRQGTGLAGALLRPVLSAIEARGLPCYLETHAERNVALYEHYGFRVAEVALDPTTGVRQWCMLRSPSAGPG
jgi:hypothetical protein